MTTFIFDGHHGEEVISSQQSADINTGLYGAGSYVLPVGSQFEPTIVSNNEVTIQDGICSIQGHRGGLDYGQSQSFTIENGTSGMMRSDLLIIRYTKDETTLVESFSFHTVKGTAAASDPEDPDITEADIRDGALVTEAALYRVHIDGLSIVAVERIWEYPESMPVSEEGAWAFVPLIAHFELTLPAEFDEDSFFRYGIFDGEKRYFAYLNPTSAVVTDTALGTLDSAYRPAEAITLRTNLAGVTVTISTAGVVKLVTPSVPAGLVCKSEIIGENSLGVGLTYKDIDRLISQTEIKELLWTNPNISAAFAAQTILSGIDLSIYDMIEIVFHNGETFVGWAETGKTFYMSRIGNIGGSSPMKGEERNITINPTSGIGFSNAGTKLANATTTTTDNTKLKPYKIYGTRI